MNDEAKKEISDGYVTLRSHFELLFAEREKQANTQYRAMDEALKVAARDIERRLEKLNELREEVTKDRVAFVRQEVYNEKSKQFDLWITDANTKLTRLMTKYDSRLTAANIISLLAIIMSIASSIFIVFLKR